MFDEDSTQKTVFDTVALDIVHDLIHGKNGLFVCFLLLHLFTVLNGTLSPCKNHLNLLAI